MPANRPSAIHNPQSAFRRLSLPVFVAALVLRAGWGIFRMIGANGPDFLEFPDERQYWTMASALWAGGGLTDELGFHATRMPLYPGVLSLFAGLTHGVVVAKAFQWLIGSIAAVLTARLASSLFGRRVALVAGMLVAFDPFLIFFSSLLLTETFFIAALLALLWTVHPMMHGASATMPLRRWLVVGLMAGVGVYVREAALGLTAMLLGLILVTRRPLIAKTTWHSVIGAGVVVAIIIILLVPWAARNSRVTGDWCWLTHRAGVSLYDGVRPEATGASDLADVQQAPDVAHLTEVEWNDHFLRKSLAAIKADPMRILRLGGVKLARLWNPLPNVDTYQSAPVRTLAGAWTIPIFVLSIGGVMILSKRSGGDGWRIAVFLLLPAMYISALHSLFVGSVRYRLPAMPTIEILAAVAIVGFLSRRASRETRS